MLATVIRYLLAGLLLAGATCASAAAPNNFDAAKKIAERLYADHPNEFYCGCKISWNKSGKDIPDLAGCGYQIRKDGPRANRIEWEHVVPASYFGNTMACWKKGGRKNCSDKDDTFARMEANLHNLVPSIGEVNGDRSNFPYGIVAGASRYGQCQTRVDVTQGVAEPRNAVKGDVARIYFYMSDRYQLALPMEQQRLFVAWNLADPVDSWEQERDRRVALHMGHRNPYVSGEKNWPELPGQKPATAISAQAAPSPPASPQIRLPATGVRGNLRSKVFHRPDCVGYTTTSPANRIEFPSIEDALKAGYRMAGNCPVQTKVLSGTVTP